MAIFQGFSLTTSWSILPSYRIPHHNFDTVIIRLLMKVLKTKKIRYYISVAKYLLLAYIACMYIDYAEGSLKCKLKILLNT